MLDTVRRLARGARHLDPAALLRRLRGLERAAGIAERERRLAAWNSKVLGSELARRLYEEGAAGRLAPLPPEPTLAGLDGRLCRQEDIESDWLRHWCGQLGFVPLYHRKVWEDCYALQQLHERGMVSSGRRGLGFAVGAEWLPSYLAARGVEVVATDLDPADARARPWIAVEQHGGSAESLFKPSLVDAETFGRLVTVRAADMNDVPPDLRGFDFLWSVCSFEHCGSVAKGLDFVVEAMRCLRPGGVAVHTTEFNLDPDGPTVETGHTVLFQRHHLEALAGRLARAGHRMLPMDYGVGEGLLDLYVDLPPYPLAGDWPLPRPDPEPPHLRLSVGGHVATSVGLVVEAGGVEAGGTVSPA